MLLVKDGQIKDDVTGGQVMRNHVLDPAWPWSDVQNTAEDLYEHSFFFQNEYDYVSK